MKGYDRASSILTSNKSFSEWGEFFGDPAIATAILDRLLHYCRVINTKGKSYRMKCSDEKKLLTRGCSSVAQSWRRLLLITAVIQAARGRSCHREASASSDRNRSRRNPGSGGSEVRGGSPRWYPESCGPARARIHGPAAAGAL